MADKERRVPTDGIWSSFSILVIVFFETPERFSKSTKDKFKFCRLSFKMMAKLLIYHLSLKM